MTPEAPTLSDLARELAPLLNADRYAREGDPAGVWMASDRPIRQLAIRLEAGRVPYDWAEDVDAVLIHRPFGLWPARLPDGLGVLAYHRALDTELAIGSLPMADTLDLAIDESPLRRDGNVIGFVGTLRHPAPLPHVLRQLEVTFGGSEEALNTEGERPVKRIALVNAMTDALIRDAATRKADLYLTGQVRGPARQAVDQAGIAVVAVGQDRAEAWGLREIGQRLRTRWPELAIVDQTGTSGG